MQGVGRDLRQSGAFDREHEQCEDRTDQRPWGDAMAAQETMEICEYGKMPSGRPWVAEISLPEQLGRMTGNLCS